MLNCFFSLSSYLTYNKMCLLYFMLDPSLLRLRFVPRTEPRCVSTTRTKPVTRSLTTVALYTVYNLCIFVELTIYSIKVNNLYVFKNILTVVLLR